MRTNEYFVVLKNIFLNDILEGVVDTLGEISSQWGQK